MNPWLHLLHQACFGGLAAIGFAILFQCPRHWLPLAFASGFIALATRTYILQQVSTLPLASFGGALAVALGVELLRGWPDIARSALATVGCIPMIPGSLASKAVLGLFVLSQPDLPTDAVLGETETVQNIARFSITIAAIGTALILPSLLRHALIPRHGDAEK